MKDAGANWVRDPGVSSGVDRPPEVCLCFAILAFLRLFKLLKPKPQLSSFHASFVPEVLFPLLLRTLHIEHKVIVHILGQSELSAPSGLRGILQTKLTNQQFLWPQLCSNSLYQASPRLHWRRGVLAAIVQRPSMSASAVCTAHVYTFCC